MMFDVGMRIARPDIGTLAGLTGCLKVAHLAEAHHADIIPHVANGVLSMVTSMHLCATVPNFNIMEMGPNKALGETLRELSDNSWKPEVVNGYIKLPDGPGWGIEIAEDLEKKMPYVFYSMPSLAD